MTFLLILLAVLLLAALAPVFGADRRELTPGARLLDSKALPRRPA
jgi:hypothetical protein